VQVALLEAGAPTPSPRSTCLSPSRRCSSRASTGSAGDPEPALGGRRLYLPRGRVLGGSSSINAMIYIRGNRADYDGGRRWLRGWATRMSALLQARGGQRARRGRLPRRRRSPKRQRQPLHAPARGHDDRGAQQAGHEYNPDFNGARQEGVGRFQLTQRDGLRCSCSVRTCPAEDRPNLHVITGALATRILFEATAPWASRSLAADRPRSCARSAR